MIVSPIAQPMYDLGSKEIIIILIAVQKTYIYIIILRAFTAVSSLVRASRPVLYPKSYLYVRRVARKIKNFFRF